MDYPAGYNPALRIGLDQIKRVKCDGGQSTNTLRIDLRDASYVSDGVDRLGLIDYNPGTDEVDYTQVYLVDNVTLPTPRLKTLTNSCYLSGSCRLS